MTMQPKETSSPVRRLRAALAQVPTAGWLLGMLLSTLLEHAVGSGLARAVGLSSIPPIFGVTVIFATPLRIPSALLYLLVIYVLPIGGLALLTARWTNQLTAWMLRWPVISQLAHLALFYLDLQLWATISDYRVLLAKLILIAVIVTLSLNVVNGYMGEFSCSHPGFMALGAYGASVLTVLFFTPNNILGITLLPGLGKWAPFVFFPLALIAGGLVAAFGAIFVAVPSFRTRGDYLAIISLAFTFVVKSLIENLEVFRGARGFMGMPNVATLPVVFLWAVIGVWMINNFVRSTMGRALNAVRDDETAANAMTVDTRRTKMIAFLFSAFWAGLAGGLLAHVVLRHPEAGRGAGDGVSGRPKLRCGLDGGCRRAEPADGGAAAVGTAEVDRDSDSADPDHDLPADGFDRIQGVQPPRPDPTEVETLRRGGTCRCCRLMASRSFLAVCGPCTISG